LTKHHPKNEALIRTCVYSFQTFILTMRQ